MDMFYSNFYTFLISSVLYSFCQFINCYGSLILIYCEPNFSSLYGIEAHQSHIQRFETLWKISLKNILDLWCLFTSQHFYWNWKKLKIVKRYNLYKHAHINQKTFVWPQTLFCGWVWPHFVYLRFKIAKNIFFKRKLLQKIHNVNRFNLYNLVHITQKLLFDPTGILLNTSKTLFCGWVWPHSVY